MNPLNLNLKDLLTTLLKPNETSTPTPKQDGQAIKSKDTIQIKQVVNNLPISCMVEIIPPDDIDWVYYAVLDSQDKRLIFQSEYPTVTKLRSFSIHDLNTQETELRFVCWPVHRDATGKDTMGTPTYYPLSFNSTKSLGVYDLEVAFEKEADIQLFKQVKPLLEKHYGKAALPGGVKVVEAPFDVYFPSSNTMQLSADRRNIIHELVHTTRKQLMFATKKCQYHEETEMIEEFFAEGVCNMIKDELNQSANNYLQVGAVYGSTQGYNYDFRILDPCLVTQNLQSTTGGILTLETARYYLASEAYHKMAVEYFIRTGKYFGKEFNKIYYAYLQETLADPEKELFFAICEQLMPSVERVPTRQWLSNQLLFNATFLQGEKIFMDIDDYYTHEEWIGITNINLYTTFENGSDWVCGEHKYNKNGSAVKVELFHVASGRQEYAGTHYIADYPNGFGTIKLFFNYLINSPATAHFQQQDKQANIPSTAIKIGSGLYRIQLTSGNASSTYYRLLGACMFENKDKLMVVDSNQNNPNATIDLAHYNREGKRTWLEALPFVEQICNIDFPCIQNKNCDPGILQIIYKDGYGGQQTFQRNIGYGGTYGGQQFLINATTAVLA